MRTLVFLLATVACSSAHASPSTETRATGAFHAVSLDGALDVEIRLDKATRVEVSGDADVIKLVTTEVKQGSLVIGTPDHFHSSHAVKVTITTPALDAIALDGAGRMTVAGISAPSFAVAVGGTGDVELAGASDAVAYQLDGTASIRAKDLAAKSAAVAMNGTGSMAITATDRLTVSLSGVGDIDVFGHPRSVTKSITGMGRVALR